MSTGLLPDRLIKDLAINSQMITPFTETLKTAHRISSGLSSYGYDAVLGQEIQLFNVDPHATIDPKNFDKSLLTTIHVEEGKSFRIPAYGFVLGHTAEYYRIPDDVTVLAIGKSTYARCFTSDTTVILYDGKARTFGQLLEMQAEGKQIRGPAMDTTTGEIKECDFSAVRKIGSEPVLKATFSDGSVIPGVTPDHVFYVKRVIDGETKIFPIEAKDITPDTALAQFSYDRAHQITLTSLEEVEGDRDVYCLTNSELGTFILGNGMVVSNCGLIVNVTPLEAGWDGQVTLELHNTTGMGITIYPGEGICQFLFLRGSEPCNVSYSARGGKYNGQTGVQTPLIKAD